MQSKMHKFLNSLTMARRKRQKKTKKQRKASNRRARGKKSTSSNFYLILKRLKNLKASEQRQAMSMANAAFIKQFCKQLKKLRRAKLSHKNKMSLQKHKSKLRELVSNRTLMSKRRRILSQGGGGFLIPILRFLVNILKKL